MKKITKNKVSENDTAKKIAALASERNAIQEKMWNLQTELEESVQVPRLKKLVGKTVKYSDTHYAMIVYFWGKKGSWHFIFSESQINEDGTLSTTVTSKAPYLNKEWWDADVPVYGWELVSKKEYNQFIKKFTKEMVTYATLKKYLLS